MGYFRRGFTLVELLVVVGIISLLAAILFPVFATARGAAYRTHCMSNMRQVGMATMLYSTDYTDRFVPVNHQPAATPNSRNDRTWVQLLLPYVQSFNLFQCPADSSSRPTPESTYDQDLIQGDLYSKYYTASLHSNIGYNFVYLAPIIRYSGGTWISDPKVTSSLADPSKTIMYIDSVWSGENGVASGGGSWLVAPPCRYQTVGDAKFDTFTDTTVYQTQMGGFYGNTDKASVEVYSPIRGWDTTTEESTAHYGGAWPWHRGSMNLIEADGSARSLSPQQLAAGCDVENDWKGNIYNMRSYEWLSR